jgi:hypothetical protein
MEFHTDHKDQKREQTMLDETQAMIESQRQYVAELDADRAAA